MNTTDTSAVRASEQLNWNALSDFVRPRLKNILGAAFDVRAPLVVEQFPGGHSNLTYLLRYGADEFVLRRPPLGKVPPKAHDMAREFRILAAVHPVFPLAPRPFVLCEDAEIIGATFYVMERRCGVIVRAQEPPQLLGDPAARQRLSTNVIDTLAALHRVNVTSGELAALGKPAGFVARQVKGWSERWRGAQTSEVAEMDAVAAWLQNYLPPDPPTFALVHGDYKLDNVMLDSATAQALVGVFDWEMCALGDPLVDVGILLCYWIHAAQLAGDSSIGAVTNRAGYFTREELLAHYAAATGFDLSDIAFYEIFALFKLAVVLQQIFCRYARGQTDDARFAHLDERVKWLAQLASDLVVTA